MNIFEVVAIRLQSDVEEAADCTAISELGYLAPNLTVKSTDTIAKMLKRRNYWYIAHTDGQIPLVAAGTADRHYCRTLDHDSADDPLLDLPSIDSWQHDQDMQQL